PGIVHSSTSDDSGHICNLPARWPAARYSLERSRSLGKRGPVRILVTGATGVSAAGWFRCFAPWVTTSAALHARLWREPNWIAMAPKQSISALAVSYLIGIAVYSRKMIEPDHAAR